MSRSVPPTEDSSLETSESSKAAPEFLIIPAIDLMEGGVVRLEQGDAARSTRYDVAPAEIARSYQQAGARRLHVVDLDGAFAGKPKNLDVIKEIVEAVGGAGGMEVEVGGGVRSLDVVDALFSAGVSHVVVGTKAFEDQELLGEMLAAHGPRVIVGADCRDGKLATRGWTSDTPVHATPFLRRLKRELGISTVIYTDIATDGMFTGPNLEQLSEVLTIGGLEVIASGGVGSVDDIRALRGLAHPDLRGVIIGKALYDGRVQLSEALAAAREPVAPKE